MESNPPANDPKTIWRGQSTESFRMSVNEIRRRAEKHKKMARLSTMAGIVSGSLLFVFFGRAALKGPEWILRVGWGMASLGSLYFAIQSYRWLWPDKLPEEISMSTSLQSYRNELERQRDSARNPRIVSGLFFCFLGIAIVLVPALIQGAREGHSARFLLNAAPFFTLLAIWFVAVRILRMRSQRKLQQEIDELNEIEKESQS